MKNKDHLARLRQDAAKYERLIEQRKSMSWKFWSRENGRWVDTSAETFERMEQTLASLRAQIAELENETMCA